MEDKLDKRMDRWKGGQLIREKERRKEIANEEIWEWDRWMNGGQSNS